VLPGSHGFYRAFDATLAQNEQRKSRPLTMPVLAIGGAASYGEHVAEAMKLVADDVQTVVVASAGQSRASAGITRRHAYHVSGQPCTSSSGGPSPPMTACMRSSPESM